MHDKISLAFTPKCLDGVDMVLVWVQLNETHKEGKISVNVGF